MVNTLDKRSDIIFVIGFSPDIARPEIWENLQNIIDNYVCIGLNRFPVYSRMENVVWKDEQGIEHTLAGINRRCDYLFFQDHPAINGIILPDIKVNGYHENIVTYTGNLAYMRKAIVKPHQPKTFEWIVKPTYLLDPRANVVTKREVKDRYGTKVMQCLQYRNSGVGSTNFAMLLGAKEVVHVGIDLERTWNYPFNIMPKRMVPIKSPNYFTSCNEMFKNIKKFVKLTKTNPNNKLDIPYKSITEYVVH